MRKLVIALILLVVLNVGMAAGFAAFLYHPAKPPQILRIAGALEDGGYRLTLPGDYPPERVTDIKRALDHAFDTQQVEQLAVAAVAAFTPSATVSDTQVHWYIDRQQPCPVYLPATPSAADTSAAATANIVEDSVPHYQWLAHACAPKPTPFEPLQQQRARQTRFASARINSVEGTLEALNLTDYRIEINGVMRARGGRWQVALPVGKPVSIDHRTLVSMAAGVGDRLWVLAPSTEQAIGAATALSALPTQQALELANAHEWRALWTWHDGRTMMSNKFSVQLLH
ncbi:hypothetical protein R84981_000837 [Carnimonas sp. R-84981]|uniref:hypothetical protein n=1 Tax=Carnimonas bestiolae TaxID=3402172 RepID=UPI003EDB7D1B